MLDGNGIAIETNFEMCSAADPILPVLSSNCFPLLDLETDIYNDKRITN